MIGATGEVMEKMCCAFGHRELHKSIEFELNEIIVNLIVSEKVSLFFAGDIGQTDFLLSMIVRRLKNTYPNIKLVLVKPYFQNKLNSHKEYYETMYDDIIIPEELAECHYKSAIQKRNKWVIDKCDFVIDCTFRDFGGAVEAIKYAKKTGKKVIVLKK